MRRDFSMAIPLMPKATAIWLLENTSLTFAQISEFSGLHILEIESLANGSMDSRMKGFDPISSSQLTLDEIRRCEANPELRLIMKPSQLIARPQKLMRKYTPRAKRQDRPDAILWILKYYPEFSEQDICTLLGTTKPMIKSIKNKTHKDIANLKPRSPVSLGLCTEAELGFVISKASRR
ncbi:MAG: DUF1013 domain-containing protein [Holosporales bacterium]|jgi:hypothetical protein|nr:DUF1013 domain-containing protein [Holosporales bacterium]